jgi:hypothetical protein
MSTDGKLQATTRTAEAAQPAGEGYDSSADEWGKSREGESAEAWHRREVKLANGRLAGTSRERTGEASFQARQALEQARHAAENEAFMAPIREAEAKEKAEIEAKQQAELRDARRFVADQARQKADEEALKAYRLSKSRPPGVL